MKCPKCEKTDNIKFFLRHQKMNEDDEDTTANCITILHADPDCGYNESAFLDEVLGDIFPQWDEIKQLEAKINAIEHNIQGTNNFLQALAGSMISTDEDTINADAEIVEDPREEENESV